MDSTGKWNVRPVRRLLGKAHVWLGLTLGFFWALQGLTGAFLVFHREIDRFSLPSAHAGTQLSLDRLIAAARPVIPTQPESIGIIDANPSILVVNYTDVGGNRRGILLDSATGAVLNDRARRPSSPSNGNLTRWIYEFHHRLTMGETGSVLLGASGLLLLASAGWGLWLAWPRRNAWRATFDISRWRSTRQKLIGWHRAIGLCVALALILLALTGASMDFGEQLRAFSERHLPYRKPAFVPSGPLPAHPIPTDLALAIARSRFPRAAFVSLMLPSPKAPAYQLRMRQPEEWRSWSGTSMVIIDPASGAVLDAYDATKAPIVNRLLDSAFAFHSGEAGGLAARFAVMIAGLSLPLLYVTGLWAWLRRRRTLRTRRKI